MAGRPKQGIDFAGWSVNIFDGDTKIDRLLDAHGWVGFSIYFYLCQMAYKFDGYFYRWGYDDAVSTARRMGGGVSSGTVKETVAYCLQIGLFDERTFDEWGVLTSKGIQRRFCAAVQKRRIKSVIKDYWLLPDEESKGFDMCAAIDDFRPANEHLHHANSDLLPANAIKERKVKESKGKQSKAKKSSLSISDEIDCRTPDEFRQVMDEWNSLGLAKVSRITNGSDRYKQLNRRLKDYGLNEVLRAIDNVRNSDFLMGRTNNRNSTFEATFDWFIKPNNFQKVLDGNYANRRRNNGQAQSSNPFLELLQEEEGYEQN